MLHILLATPTQEKRAQITKCNNTDHKMYPIEFYLLRVPIPDWYRIPGTCHRSQKLHKIDPNSTKHRVTSVQQTAQMSSLSHDSQSFFNFVRHLSWTRSRDFPHISGSSRRLQYLFSLKVDFMTLLCAKENALWFKDFQLLDGRGGHKVLTISYNAACWNLKSDMGLSTTQCLSAAFTVCSLHSHDWYLSSLQRECCERKVGENPSTSPTWETRWRDLRTTSKTSGGFSPPPEVMLFTFFFCIGVCCSHISQHVSLLSLLQSNSWAFPVFPSELLKGLKMNASRKRALPTGMRVAPKLCNRKWKFERMFLDRYLMNLIWVTGDLIEGNNCLHFW